MAEKPDEVNAWLDDENGNRAADLILKPEDYTETVKLPGKKPGWMQRKHAYSAGGEELEGWDGPEVEESGNTTKLQYSESGLLTIIISIPYDIINSIFSVSGPDVYINDVNYDVKTMKNIMLAGANENDLIWNRVSMDYVSIRKNDADERVEETYKMSSDVWNEMVSSFAYTYAYLAMASWISQDDISRVHCLLTKLHTLIYKRNGQAFTSTFSDELQISISVEEFCYNGVLISFDKYENINYLELVFN